MFKHILVPLDGSTRAERAIPVAAQIARASGGSISLLRVAMIPSIEFETALAAVPSPNMMQTAIDAELKDAEQYLASLRKSQILQSIPTDTYVLFGSIAPTILSVVQSNHVDLIVMCSHGYTGMTRWVMGSVAGKVAYHAPVPVLILREDGPIPSASHPDPTQPLRVLIPLDGSGYAKAALEPAEQLASALAGTAGVMFHLVQVVKPSIERSEEAERREETKAVREAASYLSTTTAHLLRGLTSQSVATLQLQITWSVSTDSDVAAAILRVAENGEGIEGGGMPGRCDVIAMATHGYGGLQRWVMGSITERVLNATKLPLLIVRSPEAMHHSQRYLDA
jgi:nucleotide-binding universal stress UspA family protein